MSCTELQKLPPVARKYAMKPHHYGKLPQADGHARITGPCGDTMEFWIRVHDDRIDQARFITDGCGSSLACGSMTTILAEGRSLVEALAISEVEVLKALGGMPREDEHCALLSVTTLKAACEDFRRHSATGTQRTDESGYGETAAPGSAQAERQEREIRDQAKLTSRLSRIRHRIVVLSGKGGVGKSTVAVNLAVSLAMSGKRVGLLDVDLHGPSIPTMLGLSGEQVHCNDEAMIPVELGDLKVMSIGFLLHHGDDAVIWRGPLKMGAIKQFLCDVDWGDLDYLIIDSPPGTGDEPLSVCQLIGSLDGAVIVTTPQKISAIDVRKSITFCQRIQIPVLGIVENMSGFVCPHCGQITHILPPGGGKSIAEDMQVPFLGSIPMDPKIALACDTGRIFLEHYAESATAMHMREVINQITIHDRAETYASATTKPFKKEDASLMRIAIPLAAGKLAMHFGHCEHFALLDINSSEKRILARNDIAAPPHEPGLLPKWLSEKGATVIISGGMGQRAQDLFAQQGILVITGAPADSPENIAGLFLTGTLQTGANLCDH